MRTIRAERRLTTIMAADIVGYSRLIQADEAATLAAVKRLRSEVIEPLLADYSGRIVKLMGDGALVEFGSVVEAVACAVALQKNLAAQQADVPADHRIVFRMGINLGDVVVEGEDLLGDGVNVAARLEQLCPPGGVLISGTAYDHMKGKLGLPLDFTGEQQVKNMAQPVRTYSVRMEGVKPGWSLRARRFRRWLPGAAALLAALILLGAGLWWFWPVETASAKPSIAVLPFDNYGGDEATERLANGLTEDIITDLSRAREFDVIARNSTEAYKGKSADVRQIGRDLNVRYVLEGSIQRQGERVRATAQLIDTRTGTHVWSESWDRPVQDVFAIQTEIADHILTQFELSQGPIKTAERRAARRKRPRSLTAYDLTLLGVEKQLSPTRESVAESIEILNQAVAADPSYARAWINLAWAHSMTADYGADWEASKRAALEAAERAVALDPNDAEAHAVLGHMLGSQGDLVRAKNEFDVALRLNPGSAGILTYYLGWASGFGEPALGAELADRAIRLNPNYQPWASGSLRYAYFMAGRYEDALKVMERQTPDNYSKYAWAQRAASLAVLGRKAEAKETVEEALSRYPDLTIEEIANDPGFTEAERQRHVETMRLAGFPACAKPENIAKLKKPIRLPECQPATSQPAH